jgi:thiol-disulfide isomerase/thioredoxin
MPYEIKTIKEYEHVTKTNKLVIIHFWADWNNYDITAKNILSELEVTLAEDITFCSLDVDQEIFRDLVKDIGVYNIPAFAYFKDGNKVGVEIGLRSKEGFQDRINHYFFS